MNDLDVYECEHQNKTQRKVKSECNMMVCDKCYAEFTDVSTRPLFLAKQILTLTNKKIENMPTFMSGKVPDDSLNLWHNCNKEVLEQLKKIKHVSKDIKNEEITTKDETNYNFKDILHDTVLDGENLHNLYRHSTKLIK
ncbi:MAG: hypothetical protein HOF28_02935 [Nitrosopumilus sp.]|nr:hypothetical protein [Nitrosopumilus sp.]